MDRRHRRTREALPRFAGGEVGGVHVRDRGRVVRRRIGIERSGVAVRRRRAAQEPDRLRPKGNFRVAPGRQHRVQPVPAAPAQREAWALHRDD